MNQGRALVIFKGKLSIRDERWWEQFNTLIAPKDLKEAALNYGLSFIDIDTIIEPGSVEEASKLVRELSVLTDENGQRISKTINFKGFELWWMNYDSLMYKFCLPYTQYKPLLECLRDFSNVYLYEPPFPNLFRYFLDSHKCHYTIKANDVFERSFSIGVLIQVILSIPFVMWLKFRGPKLMMWTSDRFDPPRDHNFRMKFIYDELRKRKINFGEFIRSMESSPVVIQHALKRKRPVVYSYAIVSMVRAIGNLFVSEKIITTGNFWFRVANHYLLHTKSDIWTIHTMKFILKFIGVRTAIVVSSGSRNFPEVIACKLLGIPIVGIQHGIHPKYYYVSDFMHEFDGEKTLSVDKYGLWSEWWKQYYIQHSKAYRPEQLFVSGPMRPLEKGNVFNSTQVKDKDVPVKVLFVAEELASPKEVMPYLEALIGVKNISLYIKFRPYRDGFEEWLNENRPELLKNIDGEKILKVSMHEAIAKCDVVVGSHSTGVIESVLQLKPFVLFWTKKQGDYLALKPNYSEFGIFAENPNELIDYVRKSKDIPKEILKKLQEEIFGDPYMNGSTWVVDQVEVFLKG